MNMVDHLCLLVLPQRIQHALVRKRYQIRASEKSLGNLKGFVDLPVDIALEVSITFKYHKPESKCTWDPNNLYPDCQVSQTL